MKRFFKAIGFVIAVIVGVVMIFLSFTVGIIVLFDVLGGGC